MSDPTRLKNNIKVNRLLRKRCHSTRARRNLSAERLLEADDTQARRRRWRQSGGKSHSYLTHPVVAFHLLRRVDRPFRGRWRSSSKAQFSLLLKHARTQPQNDWCDLSRFSQA